MPTKREGERWVRLHYSARVATAPSAERVQAFWNVAQPKDSAGQQRLHQPIALLKLDIQYESLTSEGLTCPVGVNEQLIDPSSISVDHASQKTN